MWKDIWCGENRTKLGFLGGVAFNSRVKKLPLEVYPNRSGVPNKAQFSRRVHEILLHSFFNFLQSCRSVMTGLTTPSPIYNLPMIFPIFHMGFWHRSTSLCVWLSPKRLFSSRSTPTISYNSLLGSSTWTRASWQTGDLKNLSNACLNVFPLTIGLHL